MNELRCVTTGELSDVDLKALRDCLDEAFEHDFTDEDWAHTIGGWHAVMWDGSRVIAQVSVVPRELRCAERTMHTGYVEGMATREAYRRRGIASVLMRAANAHIEENYELGALSDGTDIEGFYGRLGWQEWRGPTYVDTADGPQRTSEEDGLVKVLPTAKTSGLDLDAAISCDWRTGDAW